MSHFAKTFKKLRLSQGLTQQELAEGLNVSKSRVNMYERGEREPNFEMLKIIGAFFNVDMNYLLGPQDVSGSARSNSTLLENMKAEIGQMNLSRPALIHTIEELEGLLSFANTMAGRAKEEIEEKKPALLDAAHEIDGASPQDKLEDDKYFDL